MNVIAIDDLRKVFDQEVEEFNENLDLAVQKGNKAAGRRARKNLLNIQKISKELRKLIHNKPNGTPDSN